MPTMQEAKSPSVVPQSEHELLKMEFDSVLGHPSAASHHEKTSVMLMTWDPQDDDLNVQEEVRHPQQHRCHVRTNSRDRSKSCVKSLRPTTASRPTKHN